jgi:hypothetical protein
MSAEEQLFQVWVKALPEGGFHRAGRFWPPEWTEAMVNADKLGRLEGEKYLAVRRNDPSELSTIEIVQQEHGRALTEIEMLRARVAELEPLAAGSKSAMDEIAGKLAQSEASLKLARDRVAELEALLATATEPEKKSKAK